MKLLDRLKGKLAQKSVGFGGWNLPITGGFLPFEWGKHWNWWQQGLDPLHGSGNPVVHACIDAYAQTIASLSASHYRVDSNNGRQVVELSALSRFLRSPNAYQTRSDFMLNLVKQLLYSGNAYAVAYRNERNEVDSLHIVDARGTQAYVDPDSKAIFYGMGSNPLAGDLSVMVPARDVLHIKLYTPRHPLVGVSPIENLAVSIAGNDAITGHQAVFFRNMSRPSGVLSTDMSLTADQMRQLREAWDKQSQGMNSGGIPVLANGIKFQSMSLSSQDAQLIEAFNMTKETIAMAFRVPMPLIGDTRNATYSNVEQLTSSWLATGLGFVLEHVERAIDKFFALGPRDQMQFNVDSLLRTDFAGRMSALATGVTNGIYSPNEARAKEGLPAVAFGDEPRVQAQNLPLSAVDMPKTPETPEVPTPLNSEDEEKAIAYHLIKKAMVA